MKEIIDICYISYESFMMLLKKFQISYNRSLDGVLDKLNSKLMTDGGPVSEIDQNEDEISAKASTAFALPGARRQDDGSRRTKLEVRSSCVKFSSTGREWAAVTTEGLLCYGLDEDLIFDPIALTEDVTPSAVSKCVKSHQFGQGLVMALLLNEAPLIELVVVLEHGELDVPADGPKEEEPREVARRERASERADAGARARAHAR